MIQSEYLEESEKLIRDFKRIPVLKPFEDETLVNLLKMSKVRKYTAGELIFQERYYDNWVYFLISGKVSVVKDGKQLAVLGKQGDVFGEMGIIDGSPKSASITAINPTVCIATNVNMIEKLSGNDKVAFGYILYRVFSEILAARLRVTNKELIKARKDIGWKHYSKLVNSFISGLFRKTKK